MATVIYKAAVATLDEYLASKMKRKKDVETETESLREKLDLLRLKVQERKAREARIYLEIAALLAKSALLDKELTVHSNLICGKYPACEQAATNSGFDDAHPELTEQDDGEEIVYKPPFLGRLKGRE